MRKRLLGRAAATAAKTRLVTSGRLKTIIATGVSSWTIRLPFEEQRRQHPEPRVGPRAGPESTLHSRG